MDAAAFRSEFPVLEKVAYLNAGTDGPVPARAISAAREALDLQASEGRVHAHFHERTELAEKLRTAYAARLGCTDADVALTTSTTHGLGIFIGGLDLRPGDEIVTSDQEHPGLIGAVLAARDIKGAKIVEAPFDRVHEAVTSRTALVAMSHVSWVDGEIAPAELAQVDVPVVLDGAQGIGAVPIDVAAIGADGYAASGQKWMCGPDGSGVLYVSEALRERVATTMRGYASFEDAGAGFESVLREDARRYESSTPPREALAFALGAHDALASFGWDDVYVRSRDLASRLADELRILGNDVLPRGESTLVTWRVDDDEAARERLGDQGVVVRNIPGRGVLRASVGAWNDENDLDRLLSAL